MPDELKHRAARQFVWAADCSKPADQNSNDRSPRGIASLARAVRRITGVCVASISSCRER